MGSLYLTGENKIRPGVYRRQTTDNSSVVAGADDGKVAVVLTSDWGPLGTATKITTLTTLKETYGSGVNVCKTAEKVLNAGAAELVVVRVGAESSGTKGTYAVLSSDTDEGSTTVVTLNTKYVSNRQFAITIREKLGTSSEKEMIVYEGTKVIEKFNFAGGNYEIDSFVSAVNENSSIFTATKATGAAGTIANITQQAITAGSNPTVNSEAYGNAFEVLESYRFNVICCDSSDTGVHAVMQAYVSRIKESGGLIIAVIGEPSSVALSTRLAHARAFNDECIVYVGGSALNEDGNAVEGYEAAALVAGSIASTPSNESIVHMSVPGAIELKEKLTDAQHIEAIQNGCIMFSEALDGTIWIESGVNTLVNPSADQDDGWKKIKRVKVRHELFDRINRTLETIVGKIRCDDDGIANIIKLATDVMTEMYRENKILADFSFVEDTERPHEGDSAWFLVSADDIDALEKIYLTYAFRYSSNS